MFKLSEERSKELARLYCMDIYDKEFSDELKKRTYTKRKYYSCSMDTWVEISRNSDLIINLIRDDGYFENIKVDYGTTHTRDFSHELVVAYVK